MPGLLQVLKNPALGLFRRVRFGIGEVGSGRGVDYPKECPVCESDGVLLLLMRRIVCGDRGCRGPFDAVAVPHIVSASAGHRSHYFRCCLWKNCQKTDT